MAIHHVLSVITVSTLLVLCEVRVSYAQEVNIRGNVGLNTVPDARVDKVGTMRVGASIQDPYIHSFMGFQLSEPLYLNFRQSGEYSSYSNRAIKLHPGVDFKYQISKETRNRPAIALGMNSTF